MTQDFPPLPPPVTVSRPLSVGLPADRFPPGAATTVTTVATRRNGRKDAFFLAKRPTHARVYVIGDPAPAVLREITRIEGTPTEWRVYF